MANKKKNKPSTAAPLPDTKEKKPIDVPAPSETKKQRAKPIKWEDHKKWTQRAIQHLIQNPKFRIRLFSDSTSDAKDESRRKIQASEGKSILYGQLAEAIFTTDPDPDVQAEYAADPQRYGRSTQQQFQRLKKTYQSYRRQFEVTGGGVKDDDDAENLTAKIQEEWSFYEDLHSIWSELPNYNPVGVTTSYPGQDFAGKAAALFTKKGGDAEVSSGIEDNGGTLSGSDEDDTDAEGDADISESRLDNSSDGGTLGVSDVSDIDVDELQDDSEIKKLDKKNKRILKAREDKKRALEKSRADEKAKGAKNSKKRATPNNDSLDELHLLEMRDMAARRAERNRIREKELDLAAKKQELENEKQKAKIRKMELEAKKTEQQFELFRMMISRGNGGGSQVQQGVGAFDDLLPVASTSNAGHAWGLDVNQIPQVPVGELSAELDHIQWQGNNINQGGAE